MQTRWLTLGLVGWWLATSPACSANDAEAPKSGGYGGSGAFGGSGGSTGGSGGSTGGSGGSTGGSAGTAGSAGSAGSAGAAGTAGSAGSAGSAGAAGTAGSAGAAGADAGDTTPPTVQSVSPADGTQGAAATTTLVVTFSEAMDTTTLTASTSGTACGGTLQVSADNFSSCIAMASVQFGSGNSVATMTPAANLGSLTTYNFRVTVGAKDAAGNALAAQFSTANGFSTAYFHSILIDGTNDFATTADQLASSTVGGKIFVSIDDGKLYLGAAHPDILAAGSGSGNKFVYFLISEDSTLTTGNNVSSDGKAKFGASAKMHFQWKERIDGASYSEFRTGNGSDWNTDWTTTGKSVNRSAGYVEGSIALSQLGNPTALAITTYIVDYNGDGGNGWVYNMLSGATDGTGATPRDLVDYVLIDVPATSVPNAAANLKSF